MKVAHLLTEDDRNHQAIRESYGQAAGIHRLMREQERARAREQGSDTITGKQFLADHLSKYIDALTHWLNHRRHSRGMRHVAEQFLTRVGVETAAYIAFKTALDGAFASEKRNVITRSIGTRILQEERFRIFREHAPALFNYKMAELQTSRYDYMAQSLDHAARIAENHAGERADLPEDLPVETRMAAGTFLLDTLMTVYPDLFRLIRVRGRVPGRSPYCLVLSEAAQHWMLEHGEWSALRYPVNVPMVVPPKQWATHRRGGYRYALSGRYGLLRSWRNREHTKREERRSLPTVYGALNALQETAWRVNPHLYEVATELLRHFGNGIESRHREDEDSFHPQELFDLPIPPKPVDIATNVDSRRVWRRAAYRIKKENHRRRSKRLVALTTLDVAKGLLDEAAFFFPYSLDFRGRVYPIAEYLHPQSDDFARSLLLFSEGKPLDADGARWLAIHGANTLGERDGWKASRATLDERVQWIHDHSAQIEQAGEDPFTHRWWMEADEPFQFLAFCIEWMQFIRANAQGEEYVCSLPVSMDGSCNGLQHFSAMFRDEEGAAAVNVSPSERPQDIYQQVADRVVAQLEGMLDNPIAVRLLAHGLVNRRLCKRPTMTFVYGSKRFGFHTQIIEYFNTTDRQGIRQLLTFVGEDGKERHHMSEAASLLSKLIWDALSEVVSKTPQGMYWLQTAARCIVASGRCVTWQSPCGLNVLQSYYQMRDKRVWVETVGLGHLRVRYQEEETRPNPVKQANSISPNVVHSLDASVMMQTVLAARQAGLSAFSMIHDSYGTVPTDCAALARITREEFARFYELDIVGQLYEQFKAQAPDCPEPPALGTLEVSRVLESDYFFA